MRHRIVTKSPLAAPPRVVVLGGDRQLNPSDAECRMAMATFELFKDHKGEWRWHLRHQNGNIIADSGEGYVHRDDAVNGIESVKENAASAPVKELDAPPPTVSRRD